jgi:biotin-dependent carboxylase-like uncharacterized protein
MLTTVQDEGRFGYMDKGFSPGGSLDGFYSRLANFLVGNPAWEAVLEMTVSGADLRFDSPAVFALTGADMNPLLNGNPVPMHRAVSAAKGDIFHAGFAAKGLRAYFAVAGGFGIEPALGSRSTNLRSRIGGFEGRKLQTRDVIPLRWTAASLPHMERRVFEPAKSAFGIPPSYTQEHPLVLRVVQGGQSSCFTEGGIAAFYSSVYTVRPDSDRMGVRLDGPAIESRRGTDIVSDGIALGAIQVPGSGKPIVLLNDRQTTGGYAKIGAVVTSDLWRLSQAPPGSALRFERISDADAENLYVKTGRELAGLEKLFSKGD